MFSGLVATFLAGAGRKLLVAAAVVAAVLAVSGAIWESGRRSESGQEARQEMRDVERAAKVDRELDRLTPADVDRGLRRQWQRD